jgi:hypothetical protein
MSDGFRPGPSYSAAPVVTTSSDDMERTLKALGAEKKEGGSGGADGQESTAETTAGLSQAGVVVEVGEGGGKALQAKLKKKTSFSLAFPRRGDATREGGNGKEAGIAASLKRMLASKK